MVPKEDWRMEGVGSADRSGKRAEVISPIVRNVVKKVENTSSCLPILAYFQVEDYV